jgi:LuxR family maltose regulon positive regulatory protein
MIGADMDPTDLPLIRTKLAPPVIGATPVDRTSLLQQLDERGTRKVNLVLGPAGSGKTSVLAQWRRSLLLRGTKVAWYNAGPDDEIGRAHV